MTDEATADLSQKASNTNLYLPRTKIVHIMSFWPLRPLRDTHMGNKRENIYLEQYRPSPSPHSPPYSQQDQLKFRYRKPVRQQ
jgi:hypothetical protein